SFRRCYMLFNKKKQKTEMSCIKTLHGKKATKALLKSLEETSKQAERIFRANHGGGCPCPKEIANPGFWSVLTENF
ncbi:MAG: hypothetical protein ABIF84_02260, partial [Patescibacteria group bacterium]